MKRDVTNLILRLVEEGQLDRDNLIQLCLSYMSERDVAEMAELNGLLEDYYDQSIDEDEYFIEYDDED